MPLYKRLGLIDYHFFMQDKMAETVLSFAKVIKEATASNPKLSVTFYGYGLEHAGTCFLSPAMTGHCATIRRGGWIYSEQGG